MTQSDLAAKTSLSASYLSLIEKDQRTPNLDILEKIAKALGLPISIVLFLASDKSAIEELDPELAERLAQLTFELLLSNDAA